ncbi:MAG TPA: aldo/keto reductase, partial [Woeseiaceae bacterium]|nr:aldo/keto reductase [Woeseiaceae bacterium]
MPVSRREFAKAGIAGAVLAAIGGPFARAEAGALIRRPIPSSGEAIPIIGVGTNRYGVGDDLELRKPLRESLARFHELGGTVIDTAPQYRSSETVLGELIADLDIGGDLFMATKIDKESREQNATTLDRSVGLLGFPTIDLLQCHNLIGWEEAIPQLQEWKAAGRIRYLGITTSRENQYDM